MMRTQRYWISLDLQHMFVILHALNGDNLMSIERHIKSVKPLNVTQNIILTVYLFTVTESFKRCENKI